MVVSLRRFHSSQLPEGLSAPPFAGNDESNRQIDGTYYVPPTMALAWKGNGANLGHQSVPLVVVRPNPVLCTGCHKEAMAESRPPPNNAMSQK